jgi:hypothetical protein
VVIKASSRKEVDALIVDLSSSNQIKRDSAIARLTVLGARTGARVLTLAADRAAGEDARVAAFRVLESVDVPGAVDAAFAAFDDPGRAVTAAAGRVLSHALSGTRGLDVTDRLAAIAVDARRAVSARIVALHALRTLDDETIAPLLGTLRADPVREIAAAAAAKVSARTGAEPAAAGSRASGMVVDAAARGLPEDPEQLRRAIARAAINVPLLALKGVIDRVREREGSERGEARTRWSAARAAAHLALARRGSRVALYDLRETFAAATRPLPVEFVAALTEAGDASCLEPLATAYSRARGREDEWWRRHLVDAFRAIVEREKLTRRHAVSRKIAARWPEAAKELFTKSA